MKDFAATAQVFDLVFAIAALCFLLILTEVKHELSRFADALEKWKERE